MMYLIEQDGDLGDMPPHWQWVQERMRPQVNALAVYKLLCKREFGDADSPIADVGLARLVGISKSALYKALRDLEAESFLAQFYDEESGVTALTVSYPPAPTPAEEARADVIGLDRRDTVDQAADQFVKLWKNEWESAFTEGYLPSSVDRRQAIRLAKLEPDWKGIRSTITWYWRWANDGEHKTFATFVKEYDDYASERARIIKDMR